MDPEGCVARVSLSVGLSHEKLRLERALIDPLGWGGVGGGVGKGRRNGACREAVCCPCTLYFGVLHEDKEGVAHGGAHGLGATEQQVVCGHQQSIHLEVAQWIFLLLSGLKSRAI